MNFHNKKAIYLQIADVIIEGVLRKQYTEDQRITSVREFAVSIEVNPNTVHRAYAYLQDKGIIFNKRGIGYFIANGAQEKGINLLRQEFTQSDLPILVKTLDLLQLAPNELATMIQNFNSSNPTTHEN